MSLIRAPSASAFLELDFQVGHVVGQVSIAFGLTQPDAIDDGSVIELVGDDGVFGTEDGFEQSTIGIETTGVENGIVRLQEA